MSQVKSFNSNGKFYDDNNFPYGLDRSGDFTRRQVELLTEHGKVLQALCNEVLDPINTEEERFVDVCKAVLEAESEIEKAWLAYLNAINRRSEYITAFSTSAVDVVVAQGESTDEK